MQAIRQQAERAQKAAQEAKSSAGSAQTQLQRAMGDIEALRKTVLSMRDRVKDLEGHNKVSNHVSGVPGCSQLAQAALCVKAG